MCSSPKSSSTRRRQRKNNACRTDYEAYASMLRRASAVYDKKQLQKATDKSSSTLL